MSLEYNIQTLEKEISGHFIESLEGFHERNPEMTLKEALESWSDRYSAIYNTPYYMSQFTKGTLEPKFGITYSEFQESLNSVGTTFMEYVKSLLENRLKEGGLFEDSEESDANSDFEKEEIADSSDIDKDELDKLDDETVDKLFGKVSSDDEDVQKEVDKESDNPEEQANVKKVAMIKKLVDEGKVDDVEVSEDDGDKLDQILNGLSDIVEKVKVIRNTLSEKSSKDLAEVVSKKTGMTLRESEMALEMLDD